MSGDISGHGGGGEGSPLSSDADELPTAQPLGGIRHLKLSVSAEVEKRFSVEPFKE